VWWWLWGLCVLVGREYASWKPYATLRASAASYLRTDTLFR